MRRYLRDLNHYVFFPTIKLVSQAYSSARKTDQDGAQTVSEPVGRCVGIREEQTKHGLVWRNVPYHGLGIRRAMLHLVGKFCREINSAIGEVAALDKFKNCFGTVHGERKSQQVLPIPVRNPSSLGKDVRVTLDGNRTISQLKWNRRHQTSDREMFGQIGTEKILLMAGVLASRILSHLPHRNIRCGNGHNASNQRLVIGDKRSYSIGFSPNYRRRENQHPDHQYEGHYQCVFCIRIIFAGATQIIPLTLGKYAHKQLTPASCLGAV